MWTNTQPEMPVIDFAPMINSLDDARAALARLAAPDHLMVVAASEEILSCQLSMSSLEQVRDLVGAAFTSVSAGRRALRMN